MFFDAAYPEIREHGRNCREHVKINYIIGHLQYLFFLSFKKKKKKKRKHLNAMLNRFNDKPCKDKDKDENKSACKDKDKDLRQRGMQRQRQKLEKRGALNHWIQGSISRTAQVSFSTVYLSKSDCQPAFLRSFFLLFALPVVA